MSKELQQLFETHSPAVIQPRGLSDPEIRRTISEGFVYPFGILFFDIGWNNPDGGTGSDHTIKGKIEGPFPPEEMMTGVRRWWKVGKAVIFEITSRFSDRGFYDEAMWNLEQIKEGRRDGREHAQKIANELVEYMYKVEGK